MHVFFCLFFYYYFIPSDKLENSQKIFWKGGQGFVVYTYFYL